MKTGTYLVAIFALILNCDAHAETGTFIGYYSSSQAADAALDQKEISIRIGETSVAVIPVEPIGNLSVKFRIEIEDFAQFDTDAQLIEALSAEWNNHPTEMHAFVVGDLKRIRTTRSPRNSIGEFWSYLLDRTLIGISKSEIIQLLPRGTFLSTQELIAGSAPSQEQYVVSWPERNGEIVLRFGRSKRMDDYELIAFYVDAKSSKE